jgi:hypothetical protein
LVPDASVKKDPLLAQVLHRHTNRSRYDMARAAPEPAWAATMAIVIDSSMQVGFVGRNDDAALATHRQIAFAAWITELQTPRTVVESFKVLRVGAPEIAQHRDGLSLLAAVPVALARLGLFDRSKVPTPNDYGATSQIKEFSEKLDSTPGFVWMVTPTNDRATQINAGRQYVRLQLAATQ